MIKAQVGDKVIVYSGDLPHVATVERLTATQIIADDVRYNRETGYKTGMDQWHPVHIEDATDEGLKRVEVARLHRQWEIKCNVLREVHWKEVPTDTLNEVWRLVTEIMKFNRDTKQWEKKETTK